MSVEILYKWYHVRIFLQLALFAQHSVFEIFHVETYTSFNSTLYSLIV